MIRIVADAREIIFFLLAKFALHIFARTNDVALYQQVDVVHLHHLFWPNLNAFRANVIIGRLCAAFSLRAVVNNNVVGIKFKAFAGQIVFADFAVSFAHSASLLAVIVNGFVAVKSNAGCAFGQLQDVRFIFDANNLFLDVAGSFFALKAVAVKLNNIDLARRYEFAAIGVVN